MATSEWTDWPYWTVVVVNILSVGFLIFYLGLWLIHITAIVHGKRKLHRKVKLLDPEGKIQGVSIIKPLCGTDRHILDNLETFFNLQYPKYELLFCIQNTDDVKTVNGVKNLVENHPHVDVSIFYGGENVGANPKINNMMPGYRTAKYPLVLVSDAGIKMEQDTLMEMVTCMKDNVGLVFQMPYTCDGKGFATTLENIFFGTFQARYVLISDFLGINCATGMSALMRKQLLDQKGGFAAFSSYLAEDFFFAQAIKKQNYQLSISSRPAAQNTGDKSISKFEKRISRWIKLRFAMIPVTLLTEPFSECFLSGALAALACYLLETPIIIFKTDPLWFLPSFYLAHVLCWFLADLILIHIVQDGTLSCSILEYLTMWLYREFGQRFLFLRMRAIMKPDIQWGSKAFHLHRGGRVEIVPGKVDMV